MMRRAVTILGIASVVAALVLLILLGVTLKPSGDFSSMIVLVTLAASLVVASGYQVYRVIQHANQPEFPKRNLPPIGALLLFGALVGLTMAAAAISDGAHGLALLIPGFLIYLVLTCVARYKFAT